MIPSEWGTSNSPLFFLAKSYWFPGSTALEDKLKYLQCFESEKRTAMEPVGDDLMSQVAAGKCVAIRGEILWNDALLCKLLLCVPCIETHRIHFENHMPSPPPPIGLTKKYKNSTGGSKLAVDKLDLTMYSGQITALLGHNGAGKVRRGSIDVYLLVQEV